MLPLAYRIKLVSGLRSRSREALAAYEAGVAAYAPCLIARTNLPGEWLLVRWTGIRKGSGTFNTRPGLEAYQAIYSNCFSRREPREIVKATYTGCSKSCPTNPLRR